MGRGPPYVFLSPRCILFPWKANTHTLCPYPTRQNILGNSRHQHLVTVLTACWQLAHIGHCTGTPRTQDGLGGEPVYDMPYSCLKPQTLCFALPVTLTCLQEGNCLSGNV